LGYKPTDAAKIISRVATESVSDAGELIRLALKSMGS
jgi:Holliday junction DNA helicase RuvA